MNRHQTEFIKRLTQNFPKLTPAQRGLLSEALTTLTRTNTIEEIKVMIDFYPTKTPTPNVR